MFQCRLFNVPPRVNLPSPIIRSLVPRHSKVSVTGGGLRLQGKEFFLLQKYKKNLNHLKLEIFGKYFA